jgi:hypothetical protein
MNVGTKGEPDDRPDPTVDFLLRPDEARMLDHVLSEWQLRCQGLEIDAEVIAFVAILRTALDGAYAAPLDPV